MTWGVNDYPQRGRCPGACSQQCSPACGTGSAACCQCDSFAWWRVCNDLHVTLGPGYGNANTWAAASRNNGIPVDHSPRPGDILCMPSVSAAGHVAAVLAVGPTSAYGHSVPAGSVLVEDYNWSLCCCYQQHLIAISTGGAAETLFIHFGTVQPPPPPPTCPSCPTCHVCVDPAVGCVPVACGACEACSNGGCVALCGPTHCVGGVCVAPPPAMVPPALGAGLLFLGAVLAVGVWEARRHPTTTGAVVRRLEGTGPALGQAHPDLPAQVRRLEGTGPALGQAHPAITAQVRRLEDAVAHHPPGLGHGRTRSLEAAAVAHLGTVGEIRDASFVLPDGRLVGWPVGVPSLRTREATAHHTDLARTLTGSTDVRPLLEKGWMRVQNFGSVLVTEVSQPITSAQATRLREGAAPFQTVVMDAPGVGLRYPHCEATPATPSAVAGCIRTLNEAIPIERERTRAVREQARAHGLLPPEER